MITINGVKVEINHFPAGEQKITLPEFCFNKYETFNNKYIVDIKWNYECDEELISLYYIKRQLSLVTDKDVVINLEMPYCPNARMDRIKDNHEVFTLKYFSELINLMNFDSVRVENPHSTVLMALISKISQNEYDKNRINTTLFGGQIPDKIDILYFPDNGCAKKYEGLLKYPYLVGHKHRDWSTGEIEGLEVTGDIPDKPFNVLIVDDICSKGGTFYHSAKALKKLGANHIYLYITHCENTILDGDLINSGLVEKIYTTDSIFTKAHPLIEVIK